MRSSLLAIAAAALAGVSARAEMIDFRVDVSLYASVGATVDGVVHDSEYGSDPFAGFGTGAGGVLTSPGDTMASRRLLFNMNPAGHALTVGLRAGTSLGGKTVIVMVDSKPGGRRAGSGPGVTTINDPTDAARRALSALRGAYPTGFSPMVGEEFAADFAITFNADGCGLFAYPDNTASMFTQIAPYSGLVNAMAGTAEVRWDDRLFGQAGLYGSLSGFGFATLVADDGGMYNESMPEQPFNSGVNPGMTPTDIPNFYGLGVFIPAPGVPGVLLAAGVGLRRRCR